jgi:hypothetical protein
MRELASQARHGAQPIESNMRTTFVIATSICLYLASVAFAREPETNSMAGTPPTQVRDPDLQNAINSWAKGAETNGIVCGISFAPYTEKESPIFYVNLINQTTNFVRGLLRMPLEAYAHFDLLDAGGKSVPKTETGAKVGTWTDQQVIHWCERLLKSAKGKKQPKGYSDILFPLLPETVSSGISIPRMFQLKQPGDYTLHFRMCVVQAEVAPSREIDLKMFWMPEAVADVPIRPADIGLSDSPSHSETNSPAR